MLGIIHKIGFLFVSFANSIKKLALADSTFGCEDRLRIGVCSQRNRQQDYVTVDVWAVAAQHDSPKTWTSWIFQYCFLMLSHAAFFEGFAAIIQLLTIWTFFVMRLFFGTAFVFSRPSPSLEKNEIFTFKNTCFKNFQKYFNLIFDFRHLLASLTTPR